MASQPTFFFSHARQDRERSLNNYLEKFYQDLETRVAELEGIDLREMSIGTIDREISQGQDWDRQLATALKKNRAFVSVFTPLYFKRANCGKELYVFLMRSAGLGIDTNGALTGVDNVIPIRWEIKEAYFKNTEANSIVPKFLRLLNDRPSDPGNDQARTDAIKFYYDRGMRNCVTAEPHYSILLERIALLIRDLQDLPEGAGETFATAANAFDYDWTAHFGPQGASPAPAPAQPSSEQVVPKPLSSTVAFYVTRRSYAVEQTQVGFADRLIEDADPTTEPGLVKLMADLREAGVLENMHLFHAAPEPAIPQDAVSLLARLKMLSAAKVLTLVIADSDVWPGSGDAAANVIETIARSPDWTGLILVSPVGRYSQSIGQGNVPPRLVVLPQQSDLRISAIRRALVEIRGRVLSASAETLPGAEGVPVLRGVGATRRNGG